METINLTYNICVIIIAIIMFFMKYTAPNAFLKLTLTILGKIIPVFCILYAGVQIFKYFGII